VPRSFPVVLLAAVIVGCGPSAELEGIRRETNDAAERFQDRLDANRQRVTQASEAVDEASVVEAQARRHLDAVLNDADSTSQDREEANRGSVSAYRSLEAASSRMDVVIAEGEAAQDKELKTWRGLYERCMALREEAAETGGCGPIPPDR